MQDIILVMIHIVMLLS